MDRDAVLLYNKIMTAIMQEKLILEDGWGRGVSGQIYEKQLIEYRHLNRLVELVKSARDAIDKYEEDD